MRCYHYELNIFHTIPCSSTAHTCQTEAQSYAWVMTTHCAHFLVRWKPYAGHIKYGGRKEKRARQSQLRSLPRLLGNANRTIMLHHSLHTHKQCHVQREASLTYTWIHYSQKKRTINQSECLTLLQDISYDLRWKDCIEKVNAPVCFMNFKIHTQKIKQNGADASCVPMSLKWMFQWI